MQGVEDVADVGSLCAYVSELPSGSATSFGDRRYVVNSNNASVQKRWQGVPIWPQQSEVSKDDVKNGLFQLRARGNDAMICGIQGGDKMVSSAQLFLGTSQCIVLDETCKGLLLTDMKFTGTMPVVLLCWNMLLNYTEGAERVCLSQFNW
jgi:hypothetical protein